MKLDRETVQRRKRESYRFIYPPGSEHCHLCRMREIVEDVRPFIDDQTVLDDIDRMIVALESMDIFKNLGLLDMKCTIFS